MPSYTCRRKPQCIWYQNTVTVSSLGGRDTSVGIATTLRAGRSGDRIPVGGEILIISPDRPWGPPSLLYSGYRVFPGGKAAGAWC